MPYSLLACLVYLSIGLFLALAIRLGIWTTLRPFSHVKLDVRGVAREWYAVQWLVGSLQFLDDLGLCWKAPKILICLSYMESLWVYKCASWKRQ